MKPSEIQPRGVVSAGLALLAVAAPAGKAVAHEIAARNRTLKALYDAGARILLGSDAPQIFSVPGFSLEHEMPAMVEAGIPIYGVLQAGTRNAAEYFGLGEEFGSVEVGRRADLLLLDASPLADIRNVHQQAGVMVRGRWLPKEEIDAKLAEIARRMEVEEGSKE